VFNIEHQVTNQQNLPPPQSGGQASSQIQYQGKSNDQGEPGTRTQDKGSGSNTIFSMGKRRGTSPKTAQMPMKPKKESRIEQRSLCCNLWQEM
jgi:hypothetical protein